MAPARGWGQADEGEPTELAEPAPAETARPPETPLPLPATDPETFETEPSTPPSTTITVGSDEEIDSDSLGRRREGAARNAQGPQQVAPGQKVYEWHERLGVMRIDTALYANTSVRLDPAEEIIDVRLGDPAGWHLSLSTTHTFELTPVFTDQHTSVHARTRSGREYLFSVFAHGYDYEYEHDYLVDVLLHRDGVPTTEFASLHDRARVTDAVSHRRASHYEPDGPIDVVSGRVRTWEDRAGQERDWNDPHNPNVSGYRQLNELHRNDVRGPTPTEYFGNLDVAPSDPARVQMLGYWVQVNEPEAQVIVPQHIFHDGTHTFLVFPDNQQNLPVVGRLVNGVEEQTNFSTIGKRGTRIQVDAVGDLVLRHGVLIACVYLDPDGHRRNGTLAPDVGYRAFGGKPPEQRIRPTRAARTITVPTRPAESQADQTASGQGTAQPGTANAGGATPAARPEPDLKGVNRATIQAPAGTWLNHIRPDLRNGIRGGRGTWTATGLSNHGLQQLCTEAMQAGATWCGRTD